MVNMNETDQPAELDSDDIGNVHAGFPRRYESRLYMGWVRSNPSVPIAEDNLPTLVMSIGEQEGYGFHQQEIIVSEEETYSVQAHIERDGKDSTATSIQFVDAGVLYYKRESNKYDRGTRESQIPEDQLSDYEQQVVLFGGHLGHCDHRKTWRINVCVRNR